RVEEQGRVRHLKGAPSAGSIRASTPRIIPGQEHLSLFIPPVKTKPHEIPRFTAVMAQPRTTRRIRVFGTEGLLEGDISAKSITLSFPDPAGGKGASEEQIAVVSGSSGHNGGDEVLGDTFWHLAAGEDRAPRAGAAEG